jgi:CubicO group peptidase (beta-lactamase class C family)
MVQSASRNYDVPGKTESPVTTFERIAQQDGAPGFSVAVVKGSSFRFMEGFGLADLARQVPATPETVYMWFSMTKIVTATAIMQLAENGKLALDDPVGKFIPQFLEITTPSPITIRQLLNHSSGLANPVPIKWVHPASDAGPEPKAFLTRLLRENGKLKAIPGQRASYSNVGYVALGEVVACVSGKSYKDYVEERILKPLAMDNTNFVYTSGMLDRAAVGYQKRWSLMSILLPLMGIPEGILDGRVGGYLAFNRFYLDGSAYGGLIGPVRDAARFLQVHVNRGEADGARLLSPDSVALMQQISARGSKLDVGFGWFRHTSEGTGFADHLEQLGGGAGFFSEMRIYPEESLGIIVMGNATSFGIDGIIQAARRMDSS